MNVTIESNAIVEAAARALANATEWSSFWDGHDARQLASAVLTAVTPLIEANALERAAKAADGFKNDLPPGIGRGIAAAIRALRQEQPPAVMPLVEVQAIERAQREFEEKLRAVTAERDELQELLDSIRIDSLERKW